jgi:hypothetical protein
MEHVASAEVPHPDEKKFNGVAIAIGFFLTVGLIVGAFNSRDDDGAVRIPRATPNQSARVSEQNAPTSSLSVPPPGSVPVPAASAHTASKPVPVPLGTQICRGLPDGYTVEAHERRTEDLSDAHWVPAGADVYGNGERYTSTGDAFDMSYLYVPNGQSCP